MIAFFLRLFTSLWLFIVILFFTRRGSCSTYFLSTDTRGARFWKDYSFVTTDAIQGENLATYALMNEAVATDLAELGQESPFALTLRVDNTSSNPPFRNSVKIQSNYAYGDGLYVLDLNHFPSGCGVWPAFWTKTSNASSNQEIDIIQNVNGLRQGPILAVHTDQQCQIQATTASMTGTLSSQTNCQQQNHNVSGCVGYYENLHHIPAKIRGGTTNIDPQKRKNTFPAKSDQSGSSFGQSGRTVIVMQRDFQNSHGISAWAFNSTDIPDDLNRTLSLAGNGNGQFNQSIFVSTNNWPNPNILFSLPPSSCKERWQKHFLVINTGLCGGWANTTYKSSGCAAQFDTCSNQVSDQTSSFDNAFWSINSVTIFASKNFELNPVLQTHISAANVLSTLSYRTYLLGFVSAGFVVTMLM